MVPIEEAGVDAAPPTPEASADPPPLDAGADCSETFEAFLDFDDAAALADWTRHETNGTVTITDTLPDGAAPVSPPNAMLASVALDGGSATASLARTFAFIPQSVRVTYALYAPTTTPTCTLGCTLCFTGGGSTCVYLYVSLVSLYVNVGGTAIWPADPKPFFLGDIPASAFTNIETVLTMHPDMGLGSEVEAVVTRLGSDGIPLATAKLGWFGFQDGASALEVECGVPHADLGKPAAASGSAEVAIDEIAIRGCKP